MISKFLPILALAALPFASMAQRKCGTVDQHLNLIKSNPEMQKNRDQIEDHTNRFLKDHANEKATGIVYTIPVVVHVVYKTAAQNISDAQIQSQIDVLNKDYRLLNPDHTGTPALFAGLKSDAEINFCLAKQDPSGATTTGITRTLTTKTSFTTNDAVKKASTLGKDPWNTAKYLNIWVCNLSGGVLGYAQFPGGPAATDGVVITYTGFGTTGTAAAPFNKGRTATHEVGHWLNLNHIWGDDGTACTGTDNVADTPNQADENYGCPAYPTPSCSNTSDMYMNYMDYTDDACMFMFSAGQVSRMRALFATGGSRVGLLTSVGCNPVGATCNVPASLAAGSITQTSATLGWGAVSGATSYNVQLFTSGGTLISTNSSATNSYAASGLSAGTTYRFSVQTVCSGGNSAYSSQASFTTSSTTPTCNAPTGLASSSIAQTSATVSWGAVSGATSYNLQYKTAAASTFTSVTTSSTSYGLTGLTAGTAYVFQVQSVCSGGNSVVSSQAGFTTLSGTVTYCASKGNTHTDEWIDFVSYGGMNRTSGVESTGYVYYTGASANVTAGSSTTITFSTGFSSTAYTEYYRVFIDWNQNGLFTDAGEQMVSVSSSSAANLTSTFTVPATAKNGTTRMRVSMKYGSAPTSCETFTYGEVEDYNVVVTGGTARLSDQAVAVEEGSNSQLNVYPNPANTKFYLSPTDVALSEGTQIMMVDAKGRTWVNQTLSAPNNELEKTEVNVENLPNGLYNLIILTKTGTVSKKLLVLHP